MVHRENVGSSRLSSPVREGSGGKFEYKQKKSKKKPSKEFVKEYLADAERRRKKGDPDKEKRDAAHARLRALDWKHIR